MVCVIFSKSKNFQNVSWIFISLVIRAPDSSCGVSVEQSVGIRVVILNHYCCLLRMRHKCKAVEPRVLCKARKRTQRTYKKEEGVPGLVGCILHDSTL